MFVKALAKFWNIAWNNEMSVNYKHPPKDSEAHLKVSAATQWTYVFLFSFSVDSEHTQKAWFFLLFCSNLLSAICPLMFMRYIHKAME